jgi:hypothetical protein
MRGRANGLILLSFKPRLAMGTSGPAINELVYFMVQNLALFGHFGPELDIHETGPTISAST